jgi:hypothetical protein
MREHFFEVVLQLDWSFLMQWPVPKFHRHRLIVNCNYQLNNRIF